MEWKEKWNMGKSWSSGQKVDQRADYVKLNYYLKSKIHY